MTDGPATYTRRRYLTISLYADAMERGVSISPFLVAEAVSSTALEHPEWDMDERKTWAEWEKDR